MKKLIFLLTYLFAFAFIGSAQAKTYIDWTVVNGMQRATVSNFVGIRLLTTANKNDFFYATKAISNYRAGLYQAKKANPTVTSNWKFWMPMLETNTIVRFLNTVSNTAFVTYTNVLHPIITAEIVSATNAGHVVTKAQIVTATNTLNTIAVSRATNIARSMFSNVISIQNTNRITVYNYDRSTNWILFISNKQVRVRSK